MLAVMSPVQLEILHAEVGREVNDQSRIGRENLPRELRRNAVLERQEDHIGTPRHGARVERDKAGVRECCEARVDFAPRDATGAAARSDQLVHAGVRQQEAQELSARES